MAIREWQKGDVIFKENDVGRAMYEIIDGKAGVYVSYGAADETKLTELTAGNYFGELALIEVYPRSATVVAEETLTADEIDLATLNDYFVKDPDKVKRIMAYVSHRLRELSNDYNEVCRAIYELDQTGKDSGGRGEGFWKKFQKFLGFAKNPVPEDAKSSSTEPVEVPAAAKNEDQVAETKRYNKNQVIFSAGEDGKVMYFLATGVVGIYVNYGQKDEKCLTKLQEGTFFGEMGMLEQLPRSATAVALSDNTEVDLINEETLDRMLKETPARSFMILQHLSARLRALTTDYVKACRTLQEIKRAEEEGVSLDAEYLALQAVYIAQAQSMGMWL